MLYFKETNKVFILIVEISKKWSINVIILFQIKPRISIFFIEKCKIKYKNAISDMWRPL